jgi:hypothetical protein
MNRKALTLASLNVRSLGRNSPKQKEIRSWVSSLATPPHILLLHEHHLGEMDCSNSTKGIELWNGASFWNHGIPMGHSQRMSTGTSILVDRFIAPLIIANDILLEGRAQFITFHIPNNENLTIINVYAARSSNERVLMWKRLNEASFTVDHVILGSDFNHFEEIDRRRIVGERLMHKMEVAAWHHMTL